MYSKKKEVSMRISFITILIMTLLFNLFQPVLAVDLELNTKQNLIFSARGFYAFSESANQELKNLLRQNKSVAIIISSFEGKKLRVAPAADNHETGKKKIIRGETIAVIAFKKGGKRYGLSASPSGPVTVEIEVQTFAGRPCQSPVNCQDDCGENLGKCCEKDSNGNQAKICVQVGLSSCGCAKK